MGNYHKDVSQPGMKTCTNLLNEKGQVMIDSNSLMILMKIKQDKIPITGENKNGIA